MFRVALRLPQPFAHSAVALVKSKQFGGIMAHDQQVKEMGRGRAFVGFSEVGVFLIFYRCNEYLRPKSLGIFGCLYFINCSSRLSFGVVLQ